MLDDATAAIGPHDDHELVILPYRGERQLPEINALIEKELSEPYIVYTYRYFVNQWPHLCFVAYARTRSAEAVEAELLDASLPQHRAGLYPVGVIVSKLDRHLKGKRLMRGYIAMLSIREEWRGRGIAKRLIRLSLAEMIRGGAEEIVLETEADNQAALHLYESLGFIREKRLHRFYLNGKDSFRLVMPIPTDALTPAPQDTHRPPPPVDWGSDEAARLDGGLIV
ncbi:N-alpha-acetyltransferase 30 [Thecaphora frezii]